MCIDDEQRHSVHRDRDARAGRPTTRSQPAPCDREDRAHSDDANVETYPHPQQTFHASCARHVAQTEPVPLQRNDSGDDEAPERELLRKTRKQD